MARIRGFAVKRDLSSNKDILVKNVQWHYSTVLQQEHVPCLLDKVGSMFSVQKAELN